MKFLKPIVMKSLYASGYAERISPEQFCELMFQDGYFKRKKDFRGSTLYSISQKETSVELYVRASIVQGKAWDLRDTFFKRLKNKFFKQTSETL